MNTKHQTSILSNLFQNKTQAIVAELLFLFLAGIFGAVIQYYIKMPMHLPGKQGLLFMLILVSCATVSNFKGAALFTTSGAAFFFLVFQMGAQDIFKPFIFLISGATLDFLIFFWRKMNKPLIFLALAGGIAWTVIPFIRIFISLFSGFVYKSFASGIVYPLFTHFVFGSVAALIAGIALKKFYK